MIELKLHKTFSMNVKTPSEKNFFHENYDTIDKFLLCADWIHVVRSTIY